MSLLELNWQLLPEEPEDFFELDDDFDRKQLKRAYTRMIKHYKPEKYPEEFKKIRAAYESLERELRYQNSEPRQKKIIPNQDLFDGLETIKKTDPEEEEIPEDLVAYQRSLERKAKKSEKDYLHLAFLSDIVPDPKSFLERLLEGTSAIPLSQKLGSLLFDYCRLNHDPEQIPAILKHIAKSLSSQDFYQFTEPLWVILLKKKGFVLWLQTLEHCQHSLKIRGTLEENVFMIYMTRKLFWRAPLPWLERQIHSFNKHHDLVPEYMESELEFLEMLLTYRKETQELGSNHFLTTIHSTVVLYCEEDNWETEYIRIQHSILNNREELVSQNLEQLQSTALLDILNWINHELGCPFCPDSYTDELIEYKTNILRKKLIEINWRVRICFSLLNSKFRRILLLVFLGYSITLFIAFSTNYIVAGCLFCISILTLSVFIGKGLGTEFYDAASFRIYQRYWRKELLNFFAESHIPYFRFRAHVREEHYWLYHCIEEDMVLPIFTLAQNFEI